MIKNIKRLMIILIFVSCNQNKSEKAHTHQAKIAASDSVSFIENHRIKLGINLQLGGAITYISENNKNENIVNNYDWGRQIQMSFYGYPKPFEPNGKKPHEKWKNLGWNPIQSGDVGRYKSKVVSHNNDGKKLYVKSIPMHWPLENQPCECTFETWIELEENTVKVKSRLKNDRSDKNKYPARNQELPAIYNNAPYWKLMTYRGERPFTRDTLSQISKKEWDETGPWRKWLATENWAANVNDGNWGLGIWAPKSYTFIGGFAGELGTNGGTFDYPTAYISPIRKEILDHNIIFEYNYVLIVGTLEEIRSYVYERSQKNYSPHYVFTNDRQHWTYQQAVDQGWPIKNELRISLQSSNLQINGPIEFWQAKNNSVLYLRAAFSQTGNKATLKWRRFGDDKFLKKNHHVFEIVPDDSFHTYAIDLSEASNYNGAIKQISLEVENPNGNGLIKLKSVSFKKEVPK